MPKLCGVAAVVIALSTVGCVAQREPHVVIDPTYSFLRDGGLIAAAVDLSENHESIGEMAFPLDAGEDALLAPPLPRSELVRMNLQTSTE